MQCSSIKQPIDEVLRFNDIIGGIKARIKRQHDFFVVITDAMQRRKLSSLSIGSVT